MRRVVTSPAPIAIVTGGSRGIGLAIAQALSRDRHRLLLVARDAVRLDAAVRELRARDGHAVACAADLRAPGAADAVLAAARAAFGEPDVLVNVAGTAPTAKAEATTDALLDETLDLHVRAPLRLIRACLPAMKKSGRGAIVQLASTAGLRGFPFTTAYTAAKHAMVGLARALHRELQATGVRVYAVCPGFVDTDITRQAAAAVAARGKTTADAAFAAMAAQNRIGRMHSPAEVADAVDMLLQQRPAGCVFDLDRAEPAFVDDDPRP
jgi:2-hydroxycyclohexanecarboxyl-CoA dehydrogenase